MSNGNGRGGADVSAAAGHPAPCLSDQVKDVLNSIRDGLDLNYWTAADVLDAVVVEADTKWPILKAQAAIELGVSAGTLRDIVNTGQRINPRLREQYPFPFWSWSIIARDEAPEEFADSLAELADNYAGKLPPVKVIKAQLKARKNGHIETPNEIAAAALGRAHDNLNTARDHVTGRIALSEIAQAQAHIMAALGKVRE